MASDEIHLGERLLEELRRLLGDELVGSTVEAVLANAHLLVVLRIDCVHRRAVGHRLVEGRIENRHIRNALEDLLASLNAAKIRRHVKRSELNELLQGSHDLACHLDGILEGLRAVKDAVTDGINVLRSAKLLDHLLESLGVILRASAADTLHKPLGEALALLHGEELVFEGA